MFPYLIYLQSALVMIGMAYAYAKTRDVFHPMFLMLPTFGFIYGIMPYNLNEERTLVKYFTTDQLIFVQSLNCAGTLAFILGLPMLSSNTAFSAVISISTIGLYISCEPPPLVPA